jgi:hypothetical protein
MSGKALRVQHKRQNRFVRLSPSRVTISFDEVIREELNANNSALTTRCDECRPSVRQGLPSNSRRVNE